MANAALMGWDADAQIWRKLVCNAAGKLIIDPSEILENPPTEDEAGKAPQSAWAFDHAANASAHHTRYTDAEARLAMSKSIKTLEAGEHISTDVTGAGIIKLYTYGGDIYLEGLAGGVEGQFVYCFKNVPNNKVYLLHDYGTVPVGNRFALWNGVMNILPAGFYGAFWMYYTASYWWVFTDIIPDRTNLFEDSPSNGVVNKGPTSNWAYDHNANASAHHTRYTDAEALASRYANSLVLSNGTYTSQSVAGKGMLLFDTGDGDINLKGLAGGVTGQVIYCHKMSYVNDLVIVHESGDATEANRLNTFNGSDDTLADGYMGGFWMMYTGAKWLLQRKIAI